MGEIDSTWEFSDAQSLSSAAASSQTQSTDVVDMTGGTAAKDGWGSSIAESFEGGQAYVNVRLEAAMTNASSGTVEIGIYVHSAASSIKSGTKIGEINVPTASAAGWRDSQNVSVRALATTDRYIGLVYKPLTGTTTSAIFSSWLGSKQDTKP